MQTKRKIWLTAGLLSLIIVIGGLTARRGDFFKADIFGTAGPSAPTAAEVHIPTNYIAGAGENGAIEIKANKDFTNVVGFAFGLEWNAQQAEALGIDISGTPFADKGFLTEANLETAGALKAIAATGRTGVRVNRGEVFMKITLKTPPALPLGTEIPLKLVNFSIVEETSGNLSEKVLLTDDGKITVQNRGQLRVVDINPLSATSLEIVFSDFIAAATIGDFTFTPNLVNGATTLKIDGAKVIIENLTTESPFTEYRIDVSQAVKGNSAGVISPDHDFAFFTGYPTGGTLSDFYIEKVLPVDDTTFDIYFSKAVNPLSIEQVDFDIFSLNILNVKPTADPKVLRATTASQATLTQKGTCSATVTVSSLPDLALSKIADTTVINIGDIVTYTLAYRNIGTGGATNVVITDNLPAGLDFAVSTSGCTFNPVSRVITCNIGALAAGAQGSAIYTATATGEGLKTSAAIISATESELALANNSASETVQVSADNFADLIVDATLTDTTYQAVFRNSGNIAGANTVLRVDLAPTTVYQIQNPIACSVGTTACTCLANAANSQLDCQIGALAVGANGVLSFALNQVGGGTASFTANISGTAPEFNTANNTNIISKTVSAPALRLALAKNASRTVAPVGTTIDIGLRYRNESGTALTNVQLTDTVPANLDLVVGSLAPAASCTYNAATRGITCDIGALAAGAQGLISYRLTATATGETTTTATISAGNVSASATLRINVSATTAADLALFDDSLTLSGGQAIYTIFYQNSGNAAATNVRLVSSVGALAAIRDQANCIVSADRTQISCNIGNLAIGATGSITYTADILNAGTANIVSTISAVPVDYNTVNNNRTKSLVIAQAGNTQVSSTVSPTVVDIGDTVNFRIDYVNIGNIPSRNLTITDRIQTAGLLGNFAIINDGNANCVAVANGIDCLVGDLLPNATGTITYSARALAAGTAQNRVLSSDGDSDSKRILITDNLLADVSVRRSADFYFIKAGSQITYTVNYTNTGNIAAENVVLRDLAPQSTGFAITSVSPNCTVDATGISCQLGTLNPGASGTVVYTALINNRASGVLTPTATITTTTTEANTADNSDSNQITVSNSPCFLSASPTVILPGGDSTLSWATNAAYATIDRGIGVAAVPTGWATVAPPATTLYTMTTEPLGTDILVVSNDSPVWNLKSTDGDILSLNVFPFTPFGAETFVSTAPRVVKVEAAPTDTVKIYFAENVFASSATAGTCNTATGVIPGVCNIYSLHEINSLGNLVGGDLINANVQAEISADYKVITLSNLPTVAGKQYVLTVKRDTVRDFDTDLPITNFFNRGVFLGQKTTFAATDFALVSITEQTANSLTANFSLEPSDSVLNPLNFRILSFDGTRIALTVPAVEKKGKSIVLTTNTQTPDALYFLLVDPEKFVSVNGAPIGPKNVLGFFGFVPATIDVISVAPGNIVNDKENELTISGKNFAAGSVVRLGETEIAVKSILSDKIVATVPKDFAVGIYKLTVIAPNGTSDSLENAVIVSAPACSIKVLSEESYASPYRVSNENGQTRLWVRIEDCLGVSDIEKITADLRPLNGEPAALFQFGREVGDPYYDERDAPKTSPIITDDKRWFFLDVSVPPEVATAKEPKKIEIIAENKSGVKGFGTVELLITRDLTASIAPEIRDAYVFPPQVAPGDTAPLSFSVEVYDEDGASDVARAVLDLTKIGLGTRMMTLVSGQEGGSALTRACNSNDYVVGAWSECSGGLKTRTVELKSGVNCTEDSSAMPNKQESCTLSQCRSADYEASEWSACASGKQTRSYILKTGVSCEGTSAKPADETRDCTDTTSLLDWLLPTAFAESTAGNSVWFEINDLTIPASVTPGTYQLPIIVIDKEGEEARTSITLTIQRNNANAPKIDEDEIYSTPQSGAVNDGTTTFTLSVKATDINGAADIKSVTANLLEIGLPPIALKRVMDEGDGAWFTSDPLTVPRTINPGYRRLYFTATDQAGNYYTSDDFEFYVSDKTIAGTAPKIANDRSYTSPRTATNDGKTRLSFYVFVEEGDAEIESVVANLGNVAKYVGADTTLFAPTAPATPATPATPSATAPAPAPAPAPTAGERIVPLEASVKEGGKGRWYLLSGVVVDPQTQPSTEPYLIPITVSDKNGNTVEGNVRLTVSDGVLPTGALDMPHLQNAVASDNRTLQVLFSQPLDPKKITKDAFRIVESENNSITLPISAIDVAADGRSARLTTNFMNANTKYTVIADSEKLGLGKNQLNTNKVEFAAFDEKDFSGSAKIVTIKTKSKNEIEIGFTQALKYASVKENGTNFTIFEQGGGAELKVSAARFGRDGKTIVLSTADQIPNKDYYLLQKEVQNAQGEEVATKSKIFKGFVPTDGGMGLITQADFNGDGKIDFLDFTLFSTVYGRTTSDENSSMDLNGDGKIDFTDFTIFAETFGKMRDSAVGTPGAPATSPTSDFTPYEQETTGAPVFSSKQQ